MSLPWSADWWQLNVIHRGLLQNNLRFWVSRQNIPALPTSFYPPSWMAVLGLSETSLAKGRLAEDGRRFLRPIWNPPNSSFCLKPSELPAKLKRVQECSTWILVECFPQFSVEWRPWIYSSGSASWHNLSQLTNLSESQRFHRGNGIQVFTLRVEWRVKKDNAQGLHWVQF